MKMYCLKRWVIKGHELDLLEISVTVIRGSKMEETQVPDFDSRSRVYFRFYVFFLITITIIYKRLNNHD